MRQLEDIKLKQKVVQALDELHNKLFMEFHIESLILFGSFARGEEDEESDIDLLVITPRPLTRFARHKITDLVFEVNLSYDTNFSTVVVDRKSWESGLISVLPFREEILKYGIPL